MRTISRGAVGLVGLVALFFGTGCNDPKDMQIQALQEKLNEMEREKNDLEGRLGTMMADSDNAKQRALQLQQQMDDLRRQMESRPVSEAPTTDGRWTIAGPYAWTDVGTDILFDSGKSTLKADAKGIIRTIAQEVQAKYGDRNVWVVGHTDSDPIKHTAKQYQDNLDLSQARARVVALELMSAGIDPSRMIAGGQGEFSPKAPNDNKANKSQNRRVQIIAAARPTQAG